MTRTWTDCVLETPDLNNLLRSMISFWSSPLIQLSWSWISHSLGESMTWTNTETCFVASFRRSTLLFKASVTSSFWAYLLLKPTCPTRFSRVLQLPYLRCLRVSFSSRIWFAQFEQVYRWSPNGNASSTHDGTRLLIPPVTRSSLPWRERTFDSKTYTDLLEEWDLRMMSPASMGWVCFQILYWRQFSWPANDSKQVMFPAVSSL